MIKCDKCGNEIFEEHYFKILDNTKRPTLLYIDLCSYACLKKWLGIDENDKVGKGVEFL